jgi:ketosteroid isomerase-like protein
MLTIEQRLQRLEDEAAIRDLASRFADAVTRADHKTLRSLWKPDGVFMIGEPHPVACKGIEEIDALIGKLRDGKDFFVQFVHGGLVHVDGNKASARWLMREIGSGPGKSGQDYYTARRPIKWRSRDWRPCRLTSKAGAPDRPIRTLPTTKLRDPKGNSR